MQNAWFTLEPYKHCVSLTPTTSHTAHWHCSEAVASGGPVGKHSSWGHSADPCACHYRCPWVPVGSHPPVPGENISPPPTCPSCLSMPGQWGRGPAPRSPVLMPSRILGLMSCKMRRLQLTRTDGARTRLLAQHAPFSTRRILLQTFCSCSSRMPPHGVHSWYC